MNPFFAYPKLPNGVTVALNATFITVRLGERQVNIEARLGDLAKEWILILEELRAGERHIDQYRLGYPTVNVEALFHQLDSNRLLIEAGPPNRNSRDGSAVISALEQEHWLRVESSVNVEIWDLLKAGTASPALLMLLAKEYYFLTTAAIDAVAPAIARTQGAQRHALTDFLQGEYRHDRMMIKSLYACGATDIDIEQMRPLPYTRAITDLLTYWASTDPLTLMAALFILEGSEAGSRRYMELLENNVLPAGYLDGLADHERANSEENHGDISRMLFACLDYVSVTDQERISARLAQLHKVIIRRHQEFFLLAK